MSTPLLVTEITHCRRELLENFKPGEPADEAELKRLAEVLRLIADMATRIDREIALHRELMDETHARKVAAALGALHEQPETMQ
ncbi:hypothetical protein K1W69_17340 [Hoeflea sp. WL0058]|uniref:Uncharacterized protein n=1 Tax=Flavimaribacter sediminis TaxID=2865987 RepID=A0AAE3D1L1_9HYPH|nr:hypothetical protein [Flavimaribacter sediminis]MBW8638964.1 hypothetical protein [Flavimaribacter sediminis]